MFFTDRRYRLARIWSNQELKLFSHIFDGDVVNVSAWKDQDKEGLYYSDYFSNARSYSLTNYKADCRGIQDESKEIFLNLEEELPKELYEKFDVVFNHTTLEHIYDFEKAFKNICSLTKDTVIIVVPFLQEMHGDYGDFWRFSPSAMEKMFKDQGLTPLYISYNSHKNASVYVFCVATKNPDKWKSKIESIKRTTPKTAVYKTGDNLCGVKAVQNCKHKFGRFFQKNFKFLFKKNKY